MTYNVFSGTLNLTQPSTQPFQDGPGFLGFGETKLYEIWGGNRPVIGVPKFVLYFRHVVPFGTRALKEKIVAKCRTFWPLKKIGEGCVSLSQFFVPDLGRTQTLTHF